VVLAETEWVRIQGCDDKNRWARVAAGWVAIGPTERLVGARPRRAWSVAPGRCGPRGNLGRGIAGAGRWCGDVVGPRASAKRPGCARESRGTGGAQWRVEVFLGPSGRRAFLDIPVLVVGPS